MSIRVFFVDLRHGMSEYKKADVQWYEGMEAVDALNRALGSRVVEDIVADLAKNCAYLTVSWNSGETDDHSAIGGVGSLDWVIDDGSTLTVIYEDENTEEHQVDESSDWLLRNSG